MYINDQTENLKYNVRLCAENTFFFTVLHDTNAAANDMNHDLDLIKQWAHNWMMSYNSDPLKQGVEFIFSRKRNKVDHPVTLFNNTPVKQDEEHKHLGPFLDSKLSFSPQIDSYL